MEKIKN